MKMNKKGFTLIEILAAVTIMGILTGVAVAGVTRYQRNAREKAYAAMEDSVRVAAENYIQKTGIAVELESSGRVTTIDVKNTLVKENYLPQLQDPASKGKQCGGTVDVTKIPAHYEGTGANKVYVLDKYKYKVKVQCSNYRSNNGNGIVFEG